MGTNKKLQELSTYEEDCVWMSYRYCIGRHTIASHCHASDIAQNTYGRMSHERTQFMSEDICREIYDQVKFNHFINMGWYGNIPKNRFKPIDIIYSIFSKENIESYDKIREIKEIKIEWNRDINDFEYSIYYFNENDKDKNYNRTFNDIQDLEIWQQLANLFDLDSHKWCKLIDDTICEYYECWKYYQDGGKLQFKKYKIPTDRLHIGILTYIPEENIKEDNIEKP